MPKNTGKHFAETDIDRARAELWYGERSAKDREEMRIAREALWGQKFGIPLYLVEARRPRLTKRAIAEAYRMDRALVVRERPKNGDGWQAARKQARWMDADPCVYCGGSSDSYDHIEPRKRGGTNGQENLARVCHSCNHEKLTRPLLLFLAIRAQRKAAGTYKRLPPMSLKGGKSKRAVTSGS